MRLLVCEGRCNPGIAFAEAAAVAWRQVMTEGTGGTHVPVESELRERLRAYRHTPHSLTRSPVGFGAGQYYTCDVCGRERRWG